MPCAPARALGFLALPTAAIAALASPPAASAADERAVVTVKTVSVGAPGNPPVAVVPFTDAVYASCADAPRTPRGCRRVGGVRHRYGIGQLEITVAQWVAFLNTVDPEGRDRHRLYDPSQSSAAWPEYGQIDSASRARSGRHYSVADPEWADKPYGFADFPRAARFVNSLTNGRLLSKRVRSDAGFTYVSYAALYQGGLSTVGQARTPSPWGTLDQGGNAVEWTDTITSPPSGRKRGRVWRRLHGGVANAPAYQLWPSAIGLQPENNAFFDRTYPWLGFRVGVVGDLDVEG